jgi:eukaryotic-like serine/threonine-protein kinase
MIQRFALQEEIGRGVFGEVFRAIDRSTARKVAIKRLTGDAGAEAAERLRVEAEWLRRIDSPHVVRLVAEGVDGDGRPYLAVEWLEGEDLARRLRNRPPSIDEAIATGRDIALGLAALHALGVVHGDVKPANILLTKGEDGAPRATLIDLGAAYPAGPASPATGRRPGGTPAYMSPEQILGDQPIDGRTDVFALGVLLYEVVAGRRPFAGSGAYDVFLKILLQDRPLLRAVVPGVPAGLEAVVARALSRRPEGRFASGGEMAAALDAARTGPAGSPEEVAPAPPSEGRRTVTSVFASFPGAEPDAAAAFAAIAAEKGGLSHVAPGRRSVAVFGLDPDDEAPSSSHRAAEVAALALRSLPGACLSMATCSLPAGASGPSGEAIDRGLAQLGGPAGLVHMDADTAALLGERTPSFTASS